ncbi:MAG TPA: GNAT family N-acetyltransferase, partial [Gemmatimonadales bacterium]|nr:GNAT family N-acetyltransferase [Gemmatimonadales bacterium]
VPDTWPPEFLDPEALEFTVKRLREGPEQAGWWLHFIVLARGPSGPLLIGSAGYKGPPSPNGVVEIGYGIVRDHHRRGYASEAVRGLLRRAFADPAIGAVIAETLPELTASIGVLHKCGFHLIGEGSEPGVIRFELTRAAYFHSTASTTKPRVTSFAPQFLVDDLARSIAYYEKLGFTFGDPWEGFYAIGRLDGLELHLKEAPKDGAERRHRREHEHLDAAAGVDGIEAYYARCAANGATIVRPLSPTAWGTEDFYVEDPDGYVVCFGGRPAGREER